MVAAADWWIVWGGREGEVVQRLRAVLQLEADNSIDTDANTSLFQPWQVQVSQTWLVDVKIEAAAQDNYQRRVEEYAGGNEEASLSPSGHSVDAEAIPRLGAYTTVTEMNNPRHQSFHFAGDSILPPIQSTSPLFETILTKSSPTVGYTRRRHLVEIAGWSYGCSSSSSSSSMVGMHCYCGVIREAGSNSPQGVLVLNSSNSTNQPPQLINLSDLLHEQFSEMHITTRNQVPLQCAADGNDSSIVATSIYSALRSTNLVK